jgi:germination protein YpeB
VDDLFADFPSLVYDGPFSDHIMRIEPRMLKGKAGVASSDSLTKARLVSGVEALEFAGEISGRIPSYVFRGVENGTNTTVVFTRGGGVFASMLKHRQMGEKTISAERAIEIAESFMGDLGIINKEYTYYALNGGVCTINFAGTANLADGTPVIVYTDLVKVSVALDNGEIMSFDANAMITAHHERDLPAPRITEQRARRNLSAELDVQSVRLAVIPSAGQHEVLCYEFLCVSSRGNQVLVYVNAENGEEEQIMLVRISDNGTLAV